MIVESIAIPLEPRSVLQHRAGIFYVLVSENKKALRFGTSLILGDLLLRAY